VPIFARKPAGLPRWEGLLIVTLLSAIQQAHKGYFIYSTAGSVGTLIDGTLAPV